MRDCRSDIDCAHVSGWCDELGRCITEARDAETDAEADANADEGRPRIDAEAHREADAEARPDADAEAHRDADAHGAGRYLDPCTQHASCLEGYCIQDPLLGIGYCSRECSPTSYRDCAAEHACTNIDQTRALCLEAHVGQPCDVTGATTNVCGWGCFGVPQGAAHCTRPCRDASDCPGGFACSPQQDGRKFCVQMNLPCPGSGLQCPSGIGVCGSASGTWCSALCETAADCPRLFEDFPTYACTYDQGVGQKVCVRTPDMQGRLGDLQLGAPCARPEQCRSGICGKEIEDTASTDYCIEVCTVQGLCPRGFGCVPAEVGPGGEYSLFCLRAGTREFGENCSMAGDCRSGICFDGRCSRICNDGFCPTGSSCGPSGITADGVPIRVCQ